MGEGGDRERIGAVVQARMGSSRLPGKVLQEREGRFVLGWLLGGLAHAPGLDAVIVATSDESQDDPIASEMCENSAVPVHRGSLDDVAGRLLGAAGEHRLDALVRVNGDSPLLDPELVGVGVELFRQTGADVVSNVYPGRSFPVGQSVEVIRTAALADAHASMSSEEDREHVTPLFYREPERFEIVGFAADEDCSNESLAVDTPEDLELFDLVVRALEREPWAYGWRELLERKRAIVAAAD